MVFPPEGDCALSRACQGFFREPKETVNLPVPEPGGVREGLWAGGSHAEQVSREYKRTDKPQTWPRSKFLTLGKKGRLGWE